ncbi:cyclin-D1-binding protein 1 homolog [Centruroides sculpturatus]|uniref:cyclin-D1-binding protein 1 homolog n=1 Tax=Centruroides sculpturatus TaxID=218467 RepID=UPI000C6D27E0|nr:cyclin-D1-binding protein 1 homolog [Centruroides sculpturatus]
MYFCILNIFEAVKDLCIEAKAQRSTGQLKSVGTVWEKCNILQSLPKDNKDIVLVIFRDQLNIVQDALEELQQNIENENESNLEDLNPFNGFRLQPSSWTEENRLVLAPSSGLIKTARVCIKKINKAISSRGSSDSENLITELDHMADLVKSISILVDDFVLSLYPPMNYAAVQQHAEALKDHLLKLLDKTGQCHFCQDDDVQWIDFLKNAVNHNYGKINDLTNS